MASEVTGPQTEFVDVHKGESLPVTKYLEEEDIKSWFNTHYKLGMREALTRRTSKAAIEALRRVWYNGWVSITGCSGDGKSYIAAYVVRHLEREAYKDSDYNDYNRLEHLKNGIAEEGRKKYEIVPISSPDEWKSKMKPEAYQIFIIDDIFGTGCLTLENLERWRHLLDEMVIRSSLSNHRLKVIVIYNRAQGREMPREYRRYPIFHPQYLLDLDDYKYKYDKAEKQEIMERYCGKDFSNSMYHQSVNNSFPLVVRFFSENNCLSEHGYEYFCNPWRYVGDMIEDIYKFDLIMYYALAFCVMMNGKVYFNKRDFSDYGANEQYILSQLKQIISIPSNTDMSRIRFAAQMLNSLFFTEDPTDRERTVFSHDRIFNLSASSVFRKNSEKFLQLCSVDFICERVRTLEFIDTDGASLNVYSGDYAALVQRYTYEVLSGHSKRIATSVCCHDKTLVPVWTAFMEDMGSTEDVIKQEDDDGRTFLFWIVHHGCHLLLKYFLETESLEEERQEEWFKECLQQGFQGACYSRFKDSPEAVKLLIDYGIKPDQTHSYLEDDIFDVFGFEMGYLIKMEATPIHFAAQNAEPDTVRFLVAAGADVNATAKDGFAPLHRSAFQTQSPTTQALLELDADINAKTPNGITPLLEACLMGSRSVMEALLKAGADKTVVHPIFGSVFLSAIAGGRVDFSPKSLLEADAPKSSSENTWSVMHHAVINDDNYLINTLANAGVPLESTGKQSWTALHLAVVYNDPSKVTHLIEMKANTEAKASDGKTPLHLAAELGYYEICDILLNGGASPDAKTDSGMYPLNLAAKNNHAMIMNLLIQEGIDVELPSDLKDFFTKNMEFLPPGMRGRYGPMGMMDPEMMMMMMMMDQHRSRDMRY